MQQVIYTGVNPGDHTGDKAYIAFNKANQNFTELYAMIGQVANRATDTLTVTATDTLSPTSQPVTGQLVVAVNGVAYPGAATGSGNSITWNASMAGLHLTAGDLVVATYSY